MGAHFGRIGHIRRMTRMSNGHKEKGAGAGGAAVGGEID